MERNEIERRVEVFGKWAIRASVRYGYHSIKAIHAEVAYDDAVMALDRWNRDNY